MLRLLLTCEHGGNLIPAAYAPLFQGHGEILNTHQGYDIGALDLYHTLRPLADVGFYSETSRLLVELNRSLHHARLFSAYTQVLPPAEKERLLDKHYKPYREQVEQMVSDFVSAGRRVLHVAVHTFTPVLDGEERKADIGLLYNPKRKHEQAYSRKWKAALNKADKDLLVRFNYPYLGIADGFPTYLRRKFKADEYIGIELEVNQKFAQEGGDRWQHIRSLLADTLEQVTMHEKALPSKNAI
ncbi:N-formylglutamate amidohydrolase [Pontibacter ramchanderi]|uniref:Putative N-formylglutamate amidohydrolase n=1 Tax=Pontibacter ramchanderi TaxID=1179743 RepID=A0A2N3V1T8_9BACT|nr:N-formylglutamate amidohydrolase [Pontibacter ramchanderi]PKV75582.1 putative N-formylglutamate amidohydrolase [Pontibacter ramchanderi]